jgi:hypothetical protein
MAEDTHYTSPHYWVMHLGTQQLATGAPKYLFFKRDWGAPDVELLLRVKKLCAQGREALLAKQKQLGVQAKAAIMQAAPAERAAVAAAQAGAELTKQLKEQAAGLLRMQRACTLFLGHAAYPPPGDSPYKPVKDWPYELSRECEQLDNALSCAQSATWLEAYCAAA